MTEQSTNSFVLTETRRSDSKQIHWSWWATKSFRWARKTNPAIHKDCRGLQGQGNLFNSVRKKSGKVFIGLKQFAWIHFLSLTQDELYDHLDDLDVMKVEKQVNEAMTWMNNKMNLQSKQSLSQDPVVKTQEIRAKTKVPYHCNVV